jgi:hypothetical protein
VCLESRPAEQQQKQQPGAALRSPDLSGAGHRLFFSLYYVMTGIHAVHVAFGVGLLFWLARDTGRGRFSATYLTPLVLRGSDLGLPLADVLPAALKEHITLFRGRRSSPSRTSCLTAVTGAKSAVTSSSAC